MHVDTDEVADEFEDGLDDAGKRGDVKMKKIGEEWSETLDTEIQKGVKDTGEKMARTVTSDFDRAGFKPTKFVSEFDSNGSLVRRWVTEIEDKMERAVREEVSSGGFKKVGLAIGDAVGSGFNVSGRSPLIAFLIPLVGFIAEAIGAAIQGAGALVALLTIVPSLIGAIIVQAGTLFLAFKGVGGAIQGAFAAKNAKELQEAIKNLTPSAQEFVKSLLPLKDVFKDIQAGAQESFFSTFGNSVTVAAKKLQGPLMNAVIDVGQALGRLGRTVVTFFADPVFLRFFDQLIPATVRWLDKFSPAISTFLTGLANLGSAVTPLLEWFGEKFNEGLASFGQWLSDLSQDKDFLNWLEEMKVTLGNLWEALSAITGAITELVSTINDAGGDTFLTDLAEQFERLKMFFETDLGQKSIEGLIHVIQILAYAFVFLVFGVLGFLTLLELTAEFIKNGLIPWITDFFTNTLPEFFNSIYQGFLNLYQWVLGFFTGLFPWFVGWLQGLASQVGEWFANQIERVKIWAQSLPGAIEAAFWNVVYTLYNAGRNIIQGLINGILSMLGPVGGAMSTIMSKIRAFLPFSPAKEGPLSGEGDPLKSGQRIGDRLAEGIEMSTPNIESASSTAISGVVVGAGAVQMNFYGNAPSRSEASAIGNAAGSSLADTINQRNARLSVRTMSSSVAA